MNPVTDDFKLIHGIGSGIENRLHGAGVLTYAQLAALTPEEIASLMEHLIGMSAARVVQQDWIGQARQLASESNQATMEMEDSNSQHYSSFSIELLLDANNNVRRTKVLHVQSRAEDTWAGWDEASLLKFVRENAALNISTQPAAPSPELRGETIQPEPGVAATQKMTPEIADVAGQMRLVDLVVEAAKTKGEQHIIFSGQAFNMNLTLDLADVQLPRDVPLRYSAMVYAKKVGVGSRRMVGNSVGTLMPADRVRLDVNGIQLSSGVYRMDALVELTPTAKGMKPVQGLMALAEGSLLPIN